MIPHLLEEPIAPDEDPDESLARQARLRLMLASPRYEFLEVSLEAGTARVEGRVDSLWRRAHVLDILRRVPGILSVDTAELVVSGRPPLRRIREKLEFVLGRHPDGTRTVTPAFEGHRVVLAGSVPTQASLDAMVAGVSAIDGIDGVENDVVASIDRHRRDRTMAECVARCLRRRFPRQPRPQADVFSHVVVLRGAHLAGRGRDALVAALLDIPGVLQVFDGDAPASARASSPW